MGMGKGPPSDLKEYISYDSDTGNFVWLKTVNSRAKAGQRAGCLDVERYVRIKLRDGLYFGHNLAWWFVTGEWPKRPLLIDHINRDPSDNRFVNLRLSTHAQNSYNRKKCKNSQSSFKGISLVKSSGRWAAYIRVSGHGRRIGEFDTEEEAARAYDREALKAFGDFAAINFQEEP